MNDSVVFHRKAVNEDPNVLPQTQNGPVMGFYSDSINVFREGRNCSEATRRIDFRFVVGL